ncbi:MAG: hypothetical protein ACEPOZ_07470 [Marinifilaceae bacterium]
MNNECCGSQLHHTGICCHDEELQGKLAQEVMSEYIPTEEDKKNCTCGSGGKKEPGVCQCGTREKKKNPYSDMSYAGSGCGCGGNCGC